MLTRSGDGWSLAPTNFSFAGGTGTLSGRSGSLPEVHAQLRSMPLQILDIAWPGLGLEGSATGRLDYAWKGNRSGRADLKIRGLSRAGLVLASQPIDVGLAAVVGGDKAAMRAVAASGGKTIGRAQARFAPLGRGPLVAELMNAPLFAQLRYGGPADTLWRLSGTEVFDLSGPIAIGADIGGRLVDPTIRGSLRTQIGAARERGHRHGHRPAGLARRASPGRSWCSAGSPGGPAAAAAIDGSGRVTFSGGRSLLDLSFNARAGAAAQPRRHRRPGDRARCASARPRKAARSRASSGSTRGASSSAGRAPRRRCPSSQVRHRGLDAGRRDRGRAAVARGGSTSTSRATTSTVRGLGIDSRWRPTCRSAGPPTRRASPAAPTSSAAIMSSPAAISGSTAASSASAAKARPTRCSTSTPKRRSRASTPASE